MVLESFKKILLETNLRSVETPVVVQFYRLLSQTKSQGSVDFWHSLPTEDN